VESFQQHITLLLGHLQPLNILWSLVVVAEGRRIQVVVLEACVLRLVLLLSQVLR